ncbi:hypothetical protein M9H77_02724 [Catharanthus roseus]|uniref:Uncharacterized protein n=1 Tax=Catharanthus roseus TaxID=4058 RepID=A0ACC0C992_CATRO|nr:hypothetical protein M9H77_02724 [Catharanthus roseus]
MVRSSGRRGDADLGSITDRTGRVEGRPVTASSRGVKGRHSTFDILLLLPLLHLVSIMVQDSSCSTHGYSHADYGVSSSNHYVPGPANREQPVYVAPVAPASGSDGRPRHGKGKGLTGSLMSVMSKFAWSRNKRPDVVRDVSAPTQKRKKMKPSNWEQTEAAEGGPVDSEFIPSYGGHVAGRI